MYCISDFKAVEQYLSFMYRHCSFASLVCVTKTADILNLFVLNFQHKRENAGDRCMIFRHFAFSFLIKSVMI